MGLYPIGRIALFFVLTTAVSACAHSTEAVFTRQNQAAAALATMGIEAEVKNPSTLDMIYAAETQLDEACGSLRDVASRRMSGEPVGIFAQVQAMFTVDRCETETNRVERFIWLQAPPIARFYLGPKSASEPHK